MLTLPQIMVTITVFSFMLTVVNLLPSLMNNFQEKYRERLARTTRELDKFFVHVQATHIIIGAVIIGGLLGYVSGSWVFAGAITLAGIFAPRLVLSIWKDIRSSQFDAQLMDGLILIANALRSGLDIATGIELVTTNMKAPISEEFGLVLNSYRLGVPLEKALMDMTKRIRSRALETAVGAIVIQRETGGNLIKTFEQLVQTIREEAKLQKKVKAISAQGRTQVGFLAVFPWLVASFFYFVSPDTYKPALENSTGQLVLLGLIAWQAVGLLVTKRIITVDV